MTIDEELRAVEGIVQEGKQFSVQHIQRITEVTGLNDSAIVCYEKYLEKVISIAQSTLNLCSTYASTNIKDEETTNNDLTKFVQKLIEGVIESLSAMYLVIAFVEHLVLEINVPASQQIMKQSISSIGIKCSFCNKDCKGDDVVAGPSVHICLSCVRMANDIFGIRS